MRRSDGLGALHRYEMVTCVGLFAGGGLISVGVIAARDGLIPAVVTGVGAVALGVLAHRGFRGEVRRQFEGGAPELAHPDIERPLVSVLRVAIVLMPAVVVNGAMVLGPVPALRIVGTVVLFTLGFSVLLAERQLVDLERRHRKRLLLRPLFRRHGFRGGIYALTPWSDGQAG